MGRLSALTRRARDQRKRAHRASKHRKVVVVGHGGHGRSLLRAPFDMRSRLGKAYQAVMHALRLHVGEAELSAPQAALIDQAARLRLLTQLAWSELQRTGAFVRGATAPAFDAYRRAAADERAVLNMLGLRRSEVKVPALQDYLKDQQPEGDAHGKAKGSNDATDE